ncbi:hemolysin family protein, partial [Candidatus Margulisiibacteriota bacterium]
MVLFVLILLSAFFSLSETAITAIGKFKTKQLLQKKAKGAKALSKLKDNPSRLLGTILIANNIVNISASAIVTSMVIRYLQSVGWEGEALSIGIATGIMTFLILIFGEISPKTIAIKKAEKLALFAAPYIDIIGIFLKPLIQLFTFLSFPIIKLFGGEMPEKGPFVSKDDIRMFLSFSEKEGAIEAEEREMISSIFEFMTTIVREVMTPRPDMKCLDVSGSINDAIQLILERGHSRI